jgi:hypothetical protein
MVAMAITKGDTPQPEEPTLPPGLGILPGTPRRPYLAPSASTLRGPQPLPSSEVRAGVAEPSTSEETQS